MVEVSLNSSPLKFQVDTGASISIISHSTYLSLWSIPPPMQVSNIDLKTYSGEKIDVLGSITPKVLYNGQFWDLPLLVVEGDGPSLFGRNWLEHIKLNWKEIHFLHSKPLPLKLQSLLERYADLFKVLIGFKCNSVALLFFSFHLNELRIELRVLIRFESHSFILCVL